MFYHENLFYLSPGFTVDIDQVYVTQATAIPFIQSAVTFPGPPMGAKVISLLYIPDGCCLFSVFLCDHHICLGNQGLSTMVVPHVVLEKYGFFYILANRCFSTLGTPAVPGQAAPYLPQIQGYYHVEELQNTTIRVI